MELSESELFSIMERRPEMQAKKVIDVLIRRARKIFQSKKKAQDEAKAEAKKVEADKKPEEAKVDLPMTEPTEKDSAEKTKKKTIRRNLVTSPPKINQQKKRNCLLRLLRHPPKLKRCKVNR